MRSRLYALPEKGERIINKSDAPSGFGGFGGAIPLFYGLERELVAKAKLLFCLQPPSVLRIAFRELASRGCLAVRARLQIAALATTAWHAGSQAAPRSAAGGCKKKGEEIRLMQKKPNLPTSREAARRRPDIRSSY